MVWTWPLLVLRRWTAALRPGRKAGLRVLAHLLVDPAMSTMQPHPSPAPTFVIGHDRGSIKLPVIQFARIFIRCPTSGKQQERPGVRTGILRDAAYASPTGFLQESSAGRQAPVDRPAPGLRLMRPPRPAAISPQPPFGSDLPIRSTAYVLRAETPTPSTSTGNECQNSGERSEPPKVAQACQVELRSLFARSWISV